MGQLVYPVPGTLETIGLLQCVVLVPSRIRKPPPSDLLIGVAVVLACGNKKKRREQFLRKEMKNEVRMVQMSIEGVSALVSEDKVPLGQHRILQSDLIDVGPRWALHIVLIYSDGLVSCYIVELCVSLLLSVASLGAYLSLLYNISAMRCLSSWSMSLNDASFCTSAQFRVRNRTQCASKNEA